MNQNKLVFFALLDVCSAIISRDINSRVINS